MAYGTRDPLGGDEYGTDSSNIFANVASAIRRKKRKRNKKISRSRKSVRRVHRARKSSRKSGRRGSVKYTKNGQPYIILASGKARFIKGRRH